MLAAAQRRHAPAVIAAVSIAVGAAFAAVLLLGLQTDVIGVHWLAVAVWGAAGVALRSSRAERREDAERDEDVVEPDGPSDASAEPEESREPVS